MSTKLKLAQAALSGGGGGGADGLNHRHTNIILWEGGREFTDLDPVNSRFPEPDAATYTRRIRQPDGSTICSNDMFSHEQLRSTLVRTRLSL